MTADPIPSSKAGALSVKTSPAEANPYQDGREQHGPWAAGRETSPAR